MGRAGRGGGGGGSRGGGFGGSRGFGSHSGGSSHRSSFSSSSSHRSSFSSGSSHRSSFSSSSRSGSYHSHYNSGPRFFYFGGTRYSDSSYSGGYSNTPKKSGMSGWKIFWLVLLGLIIIASMLPENFVNTVVNEKTITKSTVNRQRLDSDYTKSDVWYRDDLGWITSPTTLHKGLQHFYDKTGVQPFLYITDDVGSSGYATDEQLEKFGNEVYDKYFDDECHLVVVFYEKDGKYRSFYVTGTEAKTVIDSEAGEILLDYIDHYYYSNYEESEFFSRSFSEAADRIMRVTPNYRAVIFIFLLILVIVILLFRWWKKKKKQKLDEMKQAKDILDSDLNEFGGADYTGSGSVNAAEELKKKYDK